MKKHEQLLVSALLILLSTASALAQEILSEMPYTMENGVLMCRRIIVSFNANVIDAPKGTTIVDVQKVPINEPEVAALIDLLSSSYGAPTIRKTMPHLVWGDTIVVNKRTGQPAIVPDMSQEFAFDFPAPVPLFATLEQFKSIEVVEYAEAPISIRLELDPNDQYYLNGGQWNLNKVNSSSAWNITTGSSSIKLAIFDSPGDGDPESLTDLSGKFVGGDGGLSGSHFIFVSGVAGAKTNNANGIASLGWNTPLHGYHFSVNSESGTRLPTLIDLAATPVPEHNVDIMNFSFVTLGPQNNALTLCPTSYRSVLEAVERASGAGVVLVAAAGNDNPACGGTPYTAYPAAYDGVIAVSGTNQNDEFAEPSWNFGPFVDVSAPAWGIRTTGFVNNTYPIYHGTSFAAPLVAGLAALILSVNPAFTPDEVTSFITQTAQDLGDPSHFGYGRINAYNALLKVVDDLAV